MKKICVGVLALIILLQGCDKNNDEMIISNDVKLESKIALEELKNKNKLNTKVVRDYTPKNTEENLVVEQYEAFYKRDSKSYGELWCLSRAILFIP